MIKAISRLIRMPNLAMVFLTMYLMRWSILRPILDLMGFEPQMSEWTFALLVMSTVLITAAGNVINDYHDVSADRVNHPDKVVIDRFISRRTAITVHFALNLIGILLGFFICLYLHLYWLLPLFLLAPVIMWFYSTTFKHKVIIGNLIVSCLTAMVPLLVVLFEYPLSINTNKDVLMEFPNMFRPVLYWICLFAIFAFLVSFLREVLKDAEDLEGDKEVGSKTIAVVFGRRTSKIIAFMLAIISLGGLSAIFLIFLKDWMSLTYFSLFLAIPLIFLLVQMPAAKDSKDYHKLNQLVKIIMLTGLMYAPIAYLVMNFVLS